MDGGCQVARESQKRTDFWVGKTPLSVVFFLVLFFSALQNGYPVHVSTKKEPPEKKESLTFEIALVREKKCERLYERRDVTQSHLHRIRNSARCR